ncbi:acetate--CoA ligase family protein [Notoacmeibacter sp. MSK16QG-6]|uniref:acetate--CoA ligase family protein n=1 Tax=Notoacmeibacter sp. MSK16QG-6 TaxID=2957982 RepID=UPI0020A1F964|nr:acetate--CoA ligase family protein [Notoacmeibacter sp. MSK16QG-6]MCP1200575.1 acetate--CoA ligase family protein [Notoacmeibacter sp. MSK16QG-6]
MAAQSWQKALLRPDTVALVGVSDDPAKTSGRPLKFLRAAGFSGEIYAINPNRDTVQGEKAFGSLSDLPAVPDHAFILTGAERALDALEECEAIGVPVATVLATGFAEAGAAGERNLERLHALIGRGGLRVLGPSSIGLANLHHGLNLTANAAFAESDLPKGGLFVASHSGSLIGALMSRGKRKGLGFSGLVSVGGEADLSIGDVCEAAIGDPDATGFLLFLEHMQHSDRLRRFAERAAEHGKPVAAFKLGRSEEAAELAQSHTGTLAGADEVADVFLNACGIARVNSFEGLLEITPLLQCLPAATKRRRGRVGVITTTGGGAAMAVDGLAGRGVEIVPASAQTRTRLADAGIEPGENRILDLTLAGTRYDVMRSAVEIFRQAPEFDLVLICVGSSARFNPDLAVQPAIDLISENGHPFAVFVVPDAPGAMRRLASAGVPVFEHPETCADAVSAALARREPALPPTLANIADHGGRTLDEAEAYDRLSMVPVAPWVAFDADAPLPELPFEYPVVAKVLDAAIPHKSDAGGVIVGIDGPDALADAIDQIGSNISGRLPGASLKRVLVQQMRKGVGEVLIGMRRDPQVGPVIVLAAGGVFTEIYRDTVMRLAPVDFDGAMGMIASLKITQILAGARGRQEGDLEALAHAVVEVSNLAACDDIVEAEINPMLVLPKGDGVAAVDALIRVTA